MKKCMMMTVAALTAFCAEAQTWTVDVWRGETTAVRVPNFAENADGFASTPAGVNVKIGVLKTVKYAATPEGYEYKEKLDRVVWNANEPGRKIVEVTAARDAKPGVYSCGLLNVRVIDRELPPAKDWAYFLDLWQHPWAVSRIFGVKPFSDAHYTKMRPVWETLATAGQKTLTVTLTDQPWNHQCYDAYHEMVGRVKKADGTWAFDYSLFDEYVAFGRSCGLGPDIACYTMCPWGYMVTYKNEKGETKSLKAVPGTPEFADYWGDFLVDFKKHLEAKGWFKDTYIAMDERSPEDVSNICQFVQAKAPGMKVAMAGNRKPSDFKGIVLDNYSQVLPHASPDFLAEVPARRAKGHKTTFYVCCWPPYPNTMIDSAAAENFWIGVYPAISGLDGLLRWAWNSWPQDPCRDASYGNWKAGDTFLVYPDGSPSLRFLELRRGIVAAEKIRLLRAAGLYTAELDALAKKFDLKAAVEGKAPYDALRKDVLAIVNR